MEKKNITQRAKKEILVFKMAEEELGLDVSCVKRVLKYQETHPLPQAVDSIEGVININEHIIAVIDLRKKFNIALSESKANMRIIICKAGNFIVGLIVDSVTEVIMIDKEKIDPAPPVITFYLSNAFVLGIARLEKRVITLLNLENLLTSEESLRLARGKK